CRCRRPRWSRDRDRGGTDVPVRAARSARFAAAVAVAASACTAVGPNYARPEMPTPALYRFAEATAEAQSIADMPWWQVFDDPTLQGLIEAALTNNLDLRV